MSRVIDADAVIADLQAMKRLYDSITLDGMIRGLERQPSIDAVEVVRCADCKHSQAVSWAGKGFVQCLYHSHAVSENGYCYKGERNEVTDNARAGDH